MKTVYIYNDDFTFKEIAMLDDDDFDIPDSGTLKPLPQPNYKPKFNVKKDAWQETASDAEIANWGTENAVEDEVITLPVENDGFTDYLLDLDMRVTMIELSNL